MPDAAAALAPTPGSDLAPIEAGIGQSEANIKAAAKGEREAVAKGVGEMEDISKQQTASARSFSDIIGTLKPPELQPTPKIQPTEQTNPVKAWGSSAMMVAALASLFTRTPLTTAFKSASAVLDSFHQGDVDRANFAFQKWKIDMDNYWKTADFQQKTYEEILGSTEERARLMSESYSTEAANKRAEMTAVASAFGDTIMANNESLTAQLRILDERMQNDRMLELQSGKIEQNFLVTQGMRDFDQKNPRATAEERTKHLGHLMQEAGHEWTESEIGGYTQRVQAALQRQGTPGQVWNSVASKMQTIKEYASSPPGVISQASLADAFTQIINGGRAIRGFQNQMLTQHASLVDKLMVAAQQLQHGGQLSPEQARDMITIANSVARDIDRQYAGDIKRAEAQAADLGIPNPKDVDPASYDPELISSMVGGGSATPPPEAVSLLKQHANDPVYRQSFDKHFGQGAAESALGQ